MTKLKFGSQAAAEIGRSNPVERRPKLGQRAEDGFAVLYSRTNEEIEIFCRSRFGLEAGGPSSDDQILNPVDVECE